MHHIDLYKVNLLRRFELNTAASVVRAIITAGKIQRLRVALLVLTIGFALTASAVAQTYDDLKITLAAGNGTIGSKDGPASDASFMMPAGIAVGHDGTVYVTDMAAQRVRGIAQDGRVWTIAGGGVLSSGAMWLAGGFQNGPALLARFSSPDGIAVGKSGELYIADRGNHCIRIVKNGLVDTYAGIPGSLGSADGPRSVATFDDPRGVAVDDDGTLYVADQRAGVRVISPSGDVSTLLLTIKGPTGISIGRSGDRRVLYVADYLGIDRYDVNSKSEYRLKSFPDGSESPSGDHLDAGMELGNPHSVAAFGAEDVVISDLKDSSVRYFRPISYIRFLGDVPSEYAPVTGGGATIGQYDAPMGVAVSDSGAVFVADTGNRRIVKIDTFDRSRWLSMDDALSLKNGPRDFRVVLVGQSYTWYFSTGNHTIGGHAISTLRSAPELKMKKVSLAYFQTSGAAINANFSFLQEEVSGGLGSVVVFLMKPSDIIEQYGPNPTIWKPQLLNEVDKTLKSFKDGHIFLFIVIAPSADYLSPYESANLFQERSSTDYHLDGELEASIVKAIRHSGAHVLDLFPIALREERNPSHRPIFHSDDIHYTPYGAELFGNAIGKELQRLQCWNGSQ